ncbi:MAG: PDZ domain-containing protein [Anaerolineae bacterium]|nr:PDZ domain-containing protein [Anaerolineae bacterium]NIQ81300.1 PDZ domain-containing protein [Anaerolineae bacterium]
MKERDRGIVIRRVVRGLVLTWLLLVVCLSAYMIGFAAHSLGYDPNQLRDIPTGVLHPTADEPAEFEVFWEAWGHVERDFYGELPDAQGLTYGAIRGMLRALDDPYSFFIEPSDHEVEEAHLEGRHGGIGAEYVMADGYLVVVAVLEDSPAMRADIRTGDVIIEVDGTDVMGLSQNEAIMLIRGGELGTTATLTIVREGGPGPLTVSVIREEVEVPSVVWELKEDGIGYVRISFFGARTKDELSRALQELKAQGARKLVLDLRDNPGGMVTAAVDVAGQFIDTGVVFYERDKDGNDKVFNAPRGGAATDMPLAVLVNGGTASASEIVGGAIQDHERGILIGERTFGKGSLQSIHELSDNSGIHVTIALWLTPDRHQIQDAGLVPDTELPVAQEQLDGDEDPQLAAALDYLSLVSVSVAS